MLFKLHLPMASTKYFKVHKEGVQWLGNNIAVSLQLPILSLIILGFVWQQPSVQAMRINENYLHFRWNWFCMTPTLHIKQHAAMIVTDQTTCYSLSR
jgi:hypothetical protein